MNKEYLRRATLKKVNEIRAELGLVPVRRLQKGKRSNPECCPISMSIKHKWDENTAVYTRYTLVYVDGDWFSLNKAVEKFIRAFDNGEFPTLELKDDVQTDLGIDN